VLKERSGKVSEVNLLLTAMLRYADIAADPVILSTSDHGYAPELYPLRDRFNYVITQALSEIQPICWMPAIHGWDLASWNRIALMVMQGWSMQSHCAAAFCRFAERT
jgi:hypothetical protein